MSKTNAGSQDDRHTTERRGGSHSPCLWPPGHFLKSTGHFLCRLPLGVSLSDVTTWFVHLGQESQGRDVVFFQGHRFQKCSQTLLYLAPRMVTLVKVVSARFL